MEYRTKKVGRKEYNNQNSSQIYSVILTKIKMKLKE